jgi:hypothetical protein
MISSGMERDAALSNWKLFGKTRAISSPTPCSQTSPARSCLTKKDEPSEDTLLESPIPSPSGATDKIDPEAIKQMENAMRLPVTVTGALMPDAHVGYGLPIGGVLATENVVIPYAVGVDIACRMRLSLYEVSPHLLGQKKGMFENALWEETAFGMGAKWKGSKTRSARSA